MDKPKHIGNTGRTLSNKKWCVMMFWFLEDWIWWGNKWYDNRRSAEKAICDLQSSTFPAFYCKLIKNNFIDWPDPYLHVKELNRLFLPKPKRKKGWF